MAITRHLFRLLIQEHLHKPIVGKVLLLGRQTVHLTPNDAYAVLSEFKLSPHPLAKIELDVNTATGRSYGFISDKSLFSLLTAAEVLAVDQSSYEGADVILDLCGPIPPEYEGKFDFIYNGSVLDNLFDPAGAMRNVTRLMTAGGVIFHYEGMAHWNPSYIKFLPDWFFDYYAVNRFHDFRAFVCASKQFHATWDVFEWWPYEVTNANSVALTAGYEFNLSGSECFVVVIAEKGPTSSFDKNPIQAPYRANHQEYLEAYLRYRNSSRRYQMPRRNETGFRYFGTLP